MGGPLPERKAAKAPSLLHKGLVVIIFKDIFLRRWSFYKVSSMIKSIFAIFLSVLLGGCALVSSPNVVSVRPPRQINGPVLYALGRQALLPFNLTAKAMIQFTLKGRPQPKIRGSINWVRAEDGLKLRITGFGPMGVTVFDCLVSRGWFYLYVPSHGVIYTASLDDSAENGCDLNGLADEAALILAPWTAYLKDGREVLDCPVWGVDNAPDDPLCIQFMEYGQKCVVGFARSTLAPVYFKLHGLDVRYDAPVALSDGSPYPAGFHLDMARLGLDIDVELKDIETSRAPSKTSLFNPAPFCQGRIVPLYVLLQKIKESNALM